MKKRFFFIIVTLVLALTLGACTLTTKDVELGASVSFNPEMTEQTQQKVTVEVADKALDTSDLVISYTGLTPEVAEITSEGIITALAPGKAVFEVVVELGEAKKTFVLEVEVLEVKYSVFYELNGGTNNSENPAIYKEGKYYGEFKSTALLPE